MPDAPADASAVPPGRGIRSASWIGTAIFTVTAVAAAIDPHLVVVLAAAVITSGVLFFAGIGIFFWAYAVAVNRSRTDLIGMGGLFFLVGSAPRAVQRSLLGSLAVQVLVGLVTASIHLFTPLAFGVLAWMYGLSLCGLWGARYGTFPPRPPDPPRGRRKKKAGGDADTSRAGRAAKDPAGKTAASQASKAARQPTTKAAGKDGTSTPRSRKGGGRVTPKSDAKGGRSGSGRPSGRGGR